MMRLLKARMALALTINNLTWIVEQWALLLWQCDPEWMIIVCSDKEGYFKLMIRSDWMCKLETLQVRHFSDRSVDWVVDGSCYRWDSQNGYGDMIACDCLYLNGYHPKCLVWCSISSKKCQCQFLCSSRLKTECGCHLCWNKWALGSFIKKYIHSLSSMSHNHKSNFCLQ